MHVPQCLPLVILHMLYCEKDMKRRKQMWSCDAVTSSSIFCHSLCYHFFTFLRAILMYRSNQESNLLKSAITSGWSAIIVRYLIYDASQPARRVETRCVTGCFHIKIVTARAPFSINETSRRLISNSVSFSL